MLTFGCSLYHHYMVITVGIALVQLTIVSASICVVKWFNLPPPPPFFFEHLMGIEPMNSVCQNLLESAVN